MDFSYGIFFGQIGVAHLVLDHQPGFLFRGRDIPPVFSWRLEETENFVNEINQQPIKQKPVESIQHFFSSTILKYS